MSVSEMNNSWDFSLCHFTCDTLPLVSAAVIWQVAIAPRCIPYHPYVLNCRFLWDSEEG